MCTTGFEKVTFKILLQMPKFGTPLRVLNGVKEPKIGKLGKNGLPIARKKTDCENH